MDFSITDNVVRIQVKCIELKCNKDDYSEFRIEYYNKGNKDFTCLYKFEILILPDSI